MIRIAIASNDGETVSSTPLTEAKIFKIYDLNEETGMMTYVEDRVNNLASQASDTVQFYKQLHESILSDVQVLIGSSISQLGYAYFLSSGVQVLFVEPQTPINALVAYIERIAQEYVQEESRGEVEE